MTTSPEIVLPPLPKPRAHAFSMEYSGPIFTADHMNEHYLKGYEAGRASVADRGVQAVPGEPVSAFNIQAGLSAFDEAVAAEIPCVSTVEYNSHEICKWFAKNVRERLAASPSTNAVSGERGAVAAKLRAMAINYSGGHHWDHLDAEVCEQAASLLAASVASPAAPASPSVALAEPGALAEMEARKDAAYLERNQVVAALAKAFPSGVARTAIEGWSEDWHGCVYIDLPTGQASWHFHDSQAYLFDGLPPYTGEWDGHDTPEKYRRLATLPSTPKAEGEGKQA